MDPPPPLTPLPVPPLNGGEGGEGGGGEGGDGNGERERAQRRGEEAWGRRVGEDGLPEYVYSEADEED